MASQRWQRRLVPLALSACLWLLMPAQAFGRALVRFVHGVPGVGRATVTVDDGSGEQVVGSVAFAQTTRWHSLRSGSFRWTLSGQGKALASGTATVGTGAYDILVLQTQAGVGLHIYRARGGATGTALLRVIHGAPELGTPELTVDGKVAIKSLAYTQSTPYVKLPVGTHTFGAMRPGDPMPFVTDRATVSASTAYSELVLGTRGQRVRVVMLVDRGAPLVRPAAHRTRVVTETAAASTSSVVVRPGDSLWSIARSLLGPDASDEAVYQKLVAIWDANRVRIGTGDPSLIFPGTRLQV